MDLARKVGMGVERQATCAHEGDWWATQATLVLHVTGVVMECASCVFDNRAGSFPAASPCINHAQQDNQQPVLPTNPPLQTGENIALTFEHDGVVSEDSHECLNANSTWLDLVIKLLHVALYGLSKAQDFALSLSSEGSHHILLRMRHSLLRLRRMHLLVEDVLAGSLGGDR